MIPTTVQRVPQHTPGLINERIRRKTDENVARYGAMGPDAIKSRLRELDKEWDIERLLETNAAIVSLFGVAMAAFVSNWWLLLPALVAIFLLQHTFQGWCPPIPILRRMGIRTQYEIEQERYALKALRGDFQSLAQSNGGSMNVRSGDALEAVRRQT